MKSFMKVLVILVVFATVAFASPLVSVDWLNEHLKDQGLVVVFVDRTHKDYSKGHIPGSLQVKTHLELENTTQYPPHKYITESQFKSLMEKLGITNESTVVIYDNYYGIFAARLFTIMEMYGHNMDKVKILDGGLVAWQAKGLPVVTEPTVAKKSNYKVSKVNKNIVVAWDEIYRNSIFKDKPVFVVDVRPFDEFSGQKVRTTRAGFIPNAINVTGSEAANDKATHLFKNAEEIRKAFADKNIDDSREIYVYCHSGDRAAHGYFVLKHLLGFKNVRVYDGSWLEWANLGALPVQQLKAN